MDAAIYLAIYSWLFKLLKGSMTYQKTLSDQFQRKDEVEHTLEDFVSESASS